jgi:hypothetical protein
MHWERFLHFRHPGAPSQLRSISYISAIEHHSEKVRLRGLEVAERLAEGCANGFLGKKVFMGRARKRLLYSAKS